MSASKSGSNNTVAIVVVLAVVAYLWSKKSGGTATLPGTTLPGTGTGPVENQQ